MNFQSFWSEIFNIWWLYDKFIAATLFNADINTQRGATSLILIFNSHALGVVS